MLTGVRDHKEMLFMPKKKPTELNKERAIRPALTPEAREKQLISLAYDLVEQRLMDGTATSQETTHFLKLGSQRSQVELEKLRLEKDLVVAKTEAYRSAEDMQNMYAEVITAMRKYSGHIAEDED